MSSAIEVAGLTKRYGQRAVVDDVTFELAAGRMLAFLGTNGAGKSTTISCLTGSIPFDGGVVRVAGANVATAPDTVRTRIGVVFQDSLLDDTLSVHQNLHLRGRMHGLRNGDLRSRITAIGEMIGLSDLLGRRYGSLSGGQRRRADIARALVHEPAVLFLDEPTAGLDPGSRAAVWATIRRLREARGLTVFLTTHYMEETEQADDVCIIDAGRLIARGSPESLRAAHSRSILTVTTLAPARLRAIASGAGATRAVGDDDVIEIDVADAEMARSILLAHADSTVDFEFRHGRMDDVFLSLTSAARSGR